MRVLGGVSVCPCVHVYVSACIIKQAENVNKERKVRPVVFALQEFYLLLCCVRALEATVV